MSKICSWSTFLLRNIEQGYICCMKNLRTGGLAIVTTIIFFLVGLIIHPDNSWSLSLYFAVALGWALGIAGYLDTPHISLSTKLLRSMLALFALMGVGYIFWGSDTMMIGMMRYSMAFMLYYLVASFRSSKSLKK